MVSIHIDTATTWRGGQNQVLLTVMGLRAAGDRTLLVAHPAGELRRRAAEGLELTIEALLLRLHRLVEELGHSLLVGAVGAP